MPPVMGAAAFILAEMTRTPYRRLMVHAVIPACLYFLGIFMTIDLQASRKRIRPLVETTDKGEHLDLWMAATCILPCGDNRCVAHRLLSHEVSIFAIAILTVLWALRPQRLTFRDLMAALGAARLQ